MYCNLDVLVEYVYDLIEFFLEKLLNYMYLFFSIIICNLYY